MTLPALLQNALDAARAVNRPRAEGRVRGIAMRDGALADQADLNLEVAQPASFGEDADGELYVLSQEGQVFRIVAAS